MGMDRNLPRMMLRAVRIADDVITTRVPNTLMFAFDTVLFVCIKITSFSTLIRQKRRQCLFLSPMKRDAKREPQAFAFRLTDNSPSGQHCNTLPGITNTFLLFKQFCKHIIHDTPQLVNSRQGSPKRFVSLHNNPTVNGIIFTHFIGWRITVFSFSGAVFLGSERYISW